LRRGFYGSESELARLGDVVGAAGGGNRGSLPSVICGYPEAAG